MTNNSIEKNEIIRRICILMKLTLECQHRFDSTDCCQLNGKNEHCFEGLAVTGNGRPIKCWWPACNRCCFFHL